MKFVPDHKDGQDGEAQRCRAAVVFVLIFLLAAVLVGGAAALDVLSFGGTGELTVSVVDQDDEAASGQEVKILDPETDTVVASSTTGTDGEAEFTLAQGDYEVVVEDSTKEIDLGNKKKTELAVNLTPPNSN